MALKKFVEKSVPVVPPPGILENKSDSKNPRGLFSMAHSNVTRRVVSAVGSTVYDGILRAEALSGSQRKLQEALSFSHESLDQFLAQVAAQELPERKLVLTQPSLVALETLTSAMIQLLNGIEIREIK